MPLLISNISFLFRDIQVFKICKLAKWWRHELNQILIKHEEGDISTNLYQKCLILRCNTLLVVFHKRLTIVTMATYSVCGDRVTVRLSGFLSFIQRNSVKMSARFIRHVGVLDSSVSQNITISIEINGLYVK